MQLSTNCNASSIFLHFLQIHQPRVGNFYATTMDGRKITAPLFLDMSHECYKTNRQQKNQAYLSTLLTSVVNHHNFMQILLGRVIDHVVYSSH